MMITRVKKFIVLAVASMFLALPTSPAEAGDCSNCHNGCTDTAYLCAAAAGAFSPTIAIAIAGGGFCVVSNFYCHGHCNGDSQCNE